MDDFAGELAPDGRSVERAGRPPHEDGALRVWARGYAVVPGAPAGATVEEAVAAAYRRWGGELAHHVGGEFAAAVHDPGARTLTLVHDELGVVPLFHARRPGGGVAFGSDLGDVVALTGVGQVDERYLAHLLVHGLPPHGITPYAHASRLLPAEHALWRDGALERRQRRLPAGVERFRGDDRELGERFRAALDAAIGAAIPPGANVWCELSGGLDSSTIVCVAAGRLGRRVEALSWVHPRSALSDESRWMRVVLDRHPIPWHTLDGDADPPYSALPEGFMAEPTPQAALRSATQRRLGERLRKEGVDVIVTGGGGDAVLLGDHPPPLYLADLVRPPHPVRLWRECRRWAAASAERRPPTYFLLRYGVRYARDPHLRYGPDPGAASAPWLTPSVLAATGDLRREPYPAIPADASIADRAYLDGILTSAEMLAGGARGRATGVPDRHPLLDRGLVELMRSVPWERKLSPVRDRPVQRDALRDVLPGATLARDDKSQPGQVYAESLAASREWQRRLTERPLMAEWGLVDAGRWREAVARACRGAAGGRHFVYAVAVEIWLQQLEQAPRLHETSTVE